MLADQAPASEDKLGDGAEHYFSFFLYHSVCPLGCAQFWEIDFQDTQKPSVHSPTRPTVEESHHALGPLTRQPLALRIYRRSFPATLLQRGRNWVQNLWVVSKSNYISGAGERSNCTRCNQLFSNGCPKIKVESRAGQVGMGRSCTEPTGSWHYSKTQPWREERILGLASASFASCLGTGHYVLRLAEGEQNNMDLSGSPEQRACGKLA